MIVTKFGLMSEMSIQLRKNEAPCNTIRTVWLNGMRAEPTDAATTTAQNKMHKQNVEYAAILGPTRRRVRSTVSADAMPPAPSTKESAGLTKQDGQFN